VKVAQRGFFLAYPPPAKTFLMLRLDWPEGLWRSRALARCLSTQKGFGGRERLFHVIVTGVYYTRNNPCGRSIDISGMFPRDMSATVVLSSGMLSERPQPKASISRVRPRCVSS
jgi:hypothetical protein